MEPLRAFRFVVYAGWNSEFETIRAADHYQLRQKAVDLVEKHSPQETDFIRGERVPLIR